MRIWKEHARTQTGQRLLKKEVLKETNKKLQQTSIEMYESVFFLKDRLSNSLEVWWDAANASEVYIFGWEVSIVIYSGTRFEKTNSTT